MAKLPEEIWWTEISGPARFLQEISEGVSGGKSVLVSMPDDMPWRRSMRDYIKLPEGFVRNDIDIEDAFGGADDIIEKICDYIVENNTPRMGYRDDFFEYYPKNCRNRGGVYWFKGISAKNQGKCAAFLAEYASKTKGKNLPPIVMELRETAAISRAKICAVDWRDFVTSFDSKLFAYLLVPQNLLPQRKNYLAEVCTSLFEWDAELCARAIGNYSDDILCCRFDKAFAALNKEFDKRGQDGAHFLYLYRNGKTEDINHRIWEAQLKTFFPIVEERRLGYVKKYYQTFAAALKDPKLKVTDIQTKQPVTNPYDLEIKQVHYCLTQHPSAVTQAELLELDELREIRNCIAHQDVLDYGKQELLFNL